MSAAPRRWLSLLAVCGLLVAVAAIPAGAQVAPRPTMDRLFPRCQAVGQGSDVLVGGTASARSVSVTLISPSGAIVAGPTAVTVLNGRYDGSPFTSSPKVAGEYEVRVSAGTTGTVSGFIQVPCQEPTLEFQPTCFPVGYGGDVTITGRNFTPYEPGYITYDVNGSETQSRVRIPSDGRGAFSATFSVKPSNRAHPSEATDVERQLIATGTWSPCPPVTTTSTTSTTRPTTTTSTPDDTVPNEEPATTTSLRITGTTTTIRPSDPPGPSVTVPPTIELPPVTVGATLVVTPELGPAGFVPGVTGTGFPPGPVELRWEPGIGRTIAIAGADGTFVTRVLVMPNDRLGPRAIVATGGTTVAIDAFLVVPSSVQPSGQNVQQINRIRRFNQR